MTHEDFVSRVEQIAQKGSKISVFERNLIAIAKNFSSLAKELLELQIEGKQSEKFKVFMGSDPLALNIVASDGSGYLYNNPVKEIEEQLIEFEKAYSRYPALFLFGLGNGVLLKAILNNPTHQTIVVFEPEIEILHAVLNLLDFSKELFSDRLVITKPAILTPAHYYVISKLKSVLYCARIYNLYINTPFYERYKNEILEVTAGMTECFKQRLREIGNDSTDSLIGMKHTTKHVPDMIAGIPLSQIKKQRKNKVKTAIIISTGPSLIKQLPLLKEIQNHATLISVDASYPILKKHGIKPDYVTSIERLSLTSKFFASEVSDFDDDIIFACSSLTHDKTIKNLKGRNICLIMKALGYEISFKDWDFGYLGTGQSAAHLAFELALCLGHEKIALIGQDLAFGKDNTSHARGHVLKATEIDPKTAEDKETALAYGGKGLVQTRMVWNLFRRQYEDMMIPIIKEGKIKVYNCTEGGARIEKMIEKPFKEIVELTLNEKKPKLKMIKPFSKEKQEKKIQKYSRHLKALLAHGNKTQKQFERMFLRLSKHIERINELQKTGKENKIDYEKLQLFSFELDKFKEKINDKKFGSTYSAMTHNIITNQELEFMAILTRPSDTMEEKQAKLLEWVRVQGHWLFMIAGVISVTNENLRKCAKGWLLK